MGLFRQQLRFSVLEPESVVGRTFSGRLYCSPKALWKFSCLRDFGYDPELLGRDEESWNAPLRIFRLHDTAHTTPFI